MIYCLYNLIQYQLNGCCIKWVNSKPLRLPLVELDRKYQEIIISEMLKLELL